MTGVVGREFGRERDGVRGDSRLEEDCLATMRVLDSVERAALYFLTVEPPDGEGALVWLSRPEEVMDTVHGTKDLRAAMS